jgi:sialic acid synthase SpsE
VIKYQMHIPSSEMIPNKIQFWGGSLDNILEHYNLNVSDHKKLIKHCENIGIQYLCTPFCAEAVRILDDLGVVGFKTGSGELTNFQIMKAIADTNKPVIVSTGMSSEQEIKDTVEFLNGLNVEFMLTNCTSIYPAPYRSINLRLIEELRNKFNVWVGHSDHTPNIWTALGAVGMGAKLIEKHFTLNRHLRGPDSAVSLEPNELKQMIEGIRIIDEAKGSGVKEIQDQEQQVREWAHHSVVALRDIHEGVVLTPELIGVKRPGTGIPAANLENLLCGGSIALKFIPKDTILSWSDIKVS